MNDQYLYSRNWFIAPEILVKSDPTFYHTLTVTKIFLDFVNSPIIILYHATEASQTLYIHTQ